MRILLFTFSIFLLLQQTGLAYVPINYYVSSGGVNTNNTCTDSTTPCRSIKTALKNVPRNTVSFINIARGAYTEGDMEIKAGQNVTFVGGWNNAFSQQICNPAGTTIIAGYRENSDELFWIYNLDNSQRADLTIKCLTLKKLSLGDITTAVDINAGSGGESNLTMDHIRITGFPDYAIVTYAVSNGKISTVINHATINHNRSKDYTMYIGAADGENTLHMDHVSIIQNGTAHQNNRSTLAVYSFASGTINAFLSNTILADNQMGDESPFEIGAQDTSHISLTSTNNTITDNLSSSRSGYGFSAFASGTSHLMLTFNNTILYGNHGIAQYEELYFQQSDRATLTFTADYCILGGKQTIGHISDSSTNEIHGDPQLNSTYHLQKGSPAIDAGLCGEWINIWGHYYYDRIAPVDDIDGDKRPGDWTLVGCDIGADEYKPFPWPMFLPAIVRPHLNPYTIPTTPRF